jgi:hypothetical protein
MVSRGRSWAPGAKRQQVKKIEVCLLSPQCLQRHRPTVCDKFKGLSLQHMRSVIVAKELCAHCLRHSGLDAAKVRECTKKSTQAHWLSSEAINPRIPPRSDATGGAQGGQSSVCLPH